MVPKPGEPEKCPRCGSDLTISAGARTVYCPFCRCEMSVSGFLRAEYDVLEEIKSLRQTCEDSHALTEEINRRIENYRTSEEGILREKYRQADKEQRRGHFRDAAHLYSEILLERQEAEIYWRLLLCEYGVEYVYDHTSNTHLPTITKMQINNILENDHYKDACRLAPNASVRSYYTREAEQLHDILSQYQYIYGTETPYDVFISAKQGDKNGQPIHDSMIAMELYHMLDKAGLKVFNSRVSLSPHVGARYEPYIMHALSTAKVMIVVASCEEYMFSPWIRNEWRRFLWLQDNVPSKKRLLIPYIIGNDRWEMLELGTLQHIFATTDIAPRNKLLTAIRSCFPAIDHPSAFLTQPEVISKLTDLLARLQKTHTVITPQILLEALTPFQQSLLDPAAESVRKQTTASLQNESSKHSETPASSPKKDFPEAPLPAPSARMPSSESPDKAPPSAAIQIADPALRSVLMDVLYKKSWDYITAEDLKQITELSADNLGIHDITPLKYCIHLRKLSIINHFCNSKISDITPLRALTELTELNLSGNAITTTAALSELTHLQILRLSQNCLRDIAPLSRIHQLTFLDISGNTASMRGGWVASALKSRQCTVLDTLVNYASNTVFIEDPALHRALCAKFSSPFVTQRNLASLLELNLDHSGISSVEGLEYCINLKKLSLCNTDSRSKISDISALGFLHHLTELNLSGNLVRDISPLNSLHELRTLDLSQNPITSLMPLSGLSSLTNLNIACSDTFDLVPLSKMSRLTHLNLRGNQLFDISPLSELRKLDTLNLSDNRISDISPLHRAFMLTTLNLSHNQLSNIAQLGSLSALTTLDLSFNQIADIYPLSELRALSQLNLAQNLLTDISPLTYLTDLTDLNLSYNPIVDIEPLGSLCGLISLNLCGTEIFELHALSPLRNLRQLNIGRRFRRSIFTPNKFRELSALERRGCVIFYDAP